MKLLTAAVAMSACFAMPALAGNFSACTLVAISVQGDRVVQDADDRAAQKTTQTELMDEPNMTGRLTHIYVADTKKLIRVIESSFIYV